MSGNPLNDLSKVYLDQVYKLNTQKVPADKKRWEDLGGPTPGNYDTTDDSAKLKQEALVEPKIKGYAKRANEITRKAATRPFNKESYSDWRSGFFEAITTPTTDKKALEKVSEKGNINNKVEINPKLKEAVAEMGGELLEVTDAQLKAQETAVYDTEKKDAQDNQLKARQQRQQMLKKQVLLRKLQAVRQGAGEDIVASYKPEGEVVEEVGVSSSAAMEKARKEAALRKKEEDAVKKAKNVKEEKDPPSQFEKGDDDRGNPDYMKSVSYADEEKWKRLQKMRKASKKASVRAKVDEEKKALPKLKMYRKAGNLARAGDEKSMKRQTKMVSVLNKETEKGYKKAALEKLRDGGSPKHQTQEDYKKLPVAKMASQISKKQFKAGQSGDVKTISKKSTETGKMIGVLDTHDPQRSKAKSKIKESNWRDDLLENEAYKKVVKDLKDKYPGGVLASKQDFEDHKKREAAKPKPKPKVQKPLTDAEKAQKEVDARYGRTPWNKKGSLGT